MGNETLTGDPQNGAGTQTKLIHVNADLHTRLRVEAASNKTTLRALTETIVTAWFEEKAKSGHGEA